MIKCISIIESVNIVYYFTVLGTNVLKEYADLNSLYKYNLERQCCSKPSMLMNGKLSLPSRNRFDVSFPFIY